jgi:hypothetical protein
MGWFYATEEGEMYNSCLPYRRIHLISASWTSAFPIKEGAILLAQAWHAGVLRPLPAILCEDESLTYIG